MKKIYLLFIVVVLIYLPSIHGYFQHDEWSTFAQLIILKHQGPSQLLKYLLWPDVAHYTPISRIAFFLEYLIFRLNFFGFIVISLILHLVIIYLIYLLGNIFFKNKKKSLIFSIIFAFSLAGYQAVTWVGASIGTELAVIFAILSLIFFIRSKMKLSLCFYLLSLLCKEIAIFLPFVFVTYHLVFNMRQRKFKLEFLKPLLFFIGYAALRIFFFLVPNKSSVQYVATQTQSYPQIFYNLLSFPFKVVTQSIIPVNSLIPLARFFGNIFGITNEAVIETRVCEILSIVVFFLIVLFLIWLFKSSKNIFKYALFGLSFAVFNSFIYAISPGRVGVVTLVDSRNLYFPLIGVSLMLICFVTSIKNKTVLILFAIIFLLMNANIMRADFANIYKIGGERKNIISSIKSFYPTINDKTVFLMESDKSFYGMPEDVRIPPFETGLGQILLVEYAEEKKLPDVFYENNFLGNITDTGYMEVGQHGFGYFRDATELKGIYKKFGFNVNSILSFHYDSANMKVINTTESVRSIFSKL